MKTFSEKAAAIAVIIALGLGSTSALARGWQHGPHHGPACMGCYGGAGMMQNGSGDYTAMRTTRAEQHMAWLQPTLNLRPDQQAAWQRFNTFVTAHVAQMAQRNQTLWQSSQPANTVERLQQRERNLKAHETAMTEMRTQVELFYNQLDTAQKQVFDTNFALGRGPGAMGTPGSGPRRAGANAGWGGGCW